MTVLSNDLKFLNSFNKKFCTENKVAVTFYKGSSNLDEYRIASLKSIKSENNFILLSVSTLENVYIPPVSDLILELSNEPEYVSDALRMTLHYGNNLYIIFISEIAVNSQSKVISLKPYCVEYFDLLKLSKVDKSVKDSSPVTSIEKENRQSASATMKALLRNKELPFKSKDALFEFFWNYGIETEEICYKGTKVIKEIFLKSTERKHSIAKAFGFTNYKKLIDSKSTPLSFIDHVKNTKGDTIVIKFGD
jgi:hypothetical protein